MFDMRMRRITPVFVDDCVRDTAPVLVATGMKIGLGKKVKHKIIAIFTILQTYIFMKIDVNHFCS